MRLFLSSFRLDHTARPLTLLVGDGARAAVVVNALDHVSDDARAERFEGEARTLRELGLSPEELDLRVFAGRSGDLRRALAGFGLVWATGGNAFVLREAMRRSGFEAALTERLREHSLVYGGYSAGACVAGPTLRGLELVDDATAVPDPTWEGMGLVDFSIAPHYDSAHPESERVERLVSYFRERAMPHRVLRDGQALVVVDGDVALLGGRTRRRG